MQNCLWILIRGTEEISYGESSITITLGAAELVSCTKCKVRSNMFFFSLSLSLFCFFGGTPSWISQILARKKELTSLPKTTTPVRELTSLPKTTTCVRETPHGLPQNIPGGPRRRESEPPGVVKLWTPGHQKAQTAATNVPNAQNPTLVMPREIGMDRFRRSTHWLGPDLDETSKQRCAGFA